MRPKSMREVVVANVLFVAELLVLAFVVVFVAVNSAQAAQQLPRPGECVPLDGGGQLCLPCPDPKPGMPRPACPAPIASAPVDVPVDAPLAIALGALAVGFVARDALSGKRGRA